MDTESYDVKRRERTVAVIVASVVLLIGAIIYIGASIATQKPYDFQGEGSGAVELVVIEEGSSMAEKGPELVERGIVASDPAFQTAAANNPAAGNIQPGVYRLRQGMSAAAAVRALLDNDKQVDLLDIPGGATLMDVNVVGGKKRPGIYSQISTVTCFEGSTNCVSVADLQQAGATANVDDLHIPTWARAQVAARSSDPRRLEGLIVPGKYVVDPHFSAEEILADLLKRSSKTFENTNIEARARAIGLTPYELLTAASLVEREAPEGDFDKVARVILNRLEEPMRLEFDSTVNYGLDDVEVATTAEDRARVTPWNTYAKDGLPDSPIAAAGTTAIKAMENPAPGEWLFFVTVDKSGTTVFTNTFEEHLQAVDQSLANGVLDSQR
ncbi:endolytic transglycosylase MltG [Corynebacterium sp. ES2794-CONJ1]|uniref:endolytic transglycosylase MltG n=1 Tax=unclassified Corynebacterium TaxID=2624378 RepID=UPI002169A7F8|nr:MULTISPECIES: endolytic transglycosylase MltG [unclassified Corynebacterium]MCS4489251.1 endolytic transglycosylase MltG [Corynebacterium sp. ES2775-CONJ]MCS4491064.1 endolytic transglycosylase MltG [Corynebacterium sp. ES2715-CONJ3]MCS4531055.1 endolytic transglycosylase MltG [Corynebacterium sp. ES2730-CONJ]MCU9518422.1 endolytic transglycosylase MltG [Corynebacterium sp. ES2794-CONJ1]